MKKYFRAFSMCFSTFCALPFPCKSWDEELRPLMLLFLPAVGLVIGLLWAAADILCVFLGVPALLKAAILCCTPFFLSGGMHMDGFLDVTDAVRSWRSREERLKILKDPHCGSFAVISCCLLMLFQFAALGAKSEDAPAAALILIPVASRAASGFFISLLTPLGTSQYFGMKENENKTARIAAFALIFIIDAGIGLAFLGIYGLTAAAVLIGYAAAALRAYRNLGGMSGDISGYALTIGELCGLVALALL